MISVKHIVKIYAALLGSGLLLGCQGDTDTPGNSNGNGNTGTGQSMSPEEVEEAIAGASTFVEWSAAVTQRPADYEPEQHVYSSDLIQQAYQSDDITEEEYYVLRMTAIHDPDALPASYEGEREAEPSPTTLLHEINARFDTFSAATQDQLRPYILSFDDPASYWYDPELPTAEEIIASRSSSSERVIADMERPTVSGDYFIVDGPAGTEEQQNIVQAALEHAYQRYADLGFDEPTDWIYVRMEELSDYRGEAWMAGNGGRERCHMLVDPDAEENLLQGVAAHELFHCFQNYMEEEADSFNGDWVRESTATWAEEFAFPNNNTEHEFEEEAFGTFAEYFFDTSNTREYASYLFWYFIYHRDGKTGRAVKLLLDNMFEVGEVQALMNWWEFYFEFKEYALWNLNTEPFDFYEDADDEPVLPPTNGSIVYDQIGPEQQHYEGLDLYPGAIAYYVYSVNESVEKLVIDVEDIQKNAENYNGIQMVWQAGSEVFYEDLSYRDERVFCRSREGEHVGNITLIISNGRVTGSNRVGRLEGNLRIDTRGRCDEGWRGFVMCRKRFSGIGEGHPNELLPVGTYSSRSWSRVESTLLYSERDDVYYSTADTVSRTYYYRWFWEHENWDDFTGGTLWEKIITHQQGSRTLARDVADGCPPSCSGLPRAIRSEVDEEGYITYLLEDRTFRDVGAFNSTYYNFYMPGTLGLMQGHAPAVTTDDRAGDRGVACPPEPLELRLSDDGLQLTGSYESESVSVYAQYTFE